MKDKKGHIKSDIEIVRSSTPMNSCVHTHFEAQAGRSPNKIALVNGIEQCSYSELNIAANRIAHFLLSQGIGSETLIGIAMGRSSGRIASILGVLKAGGAYLPLDPSYPREHLVRIVEDARPLLVLTESKFAQHVAFEGSRLICIDELELSERDSENPNLSVSATDLAYVMFTSGSTGKPKGVMVEHRSIVRLVKETDYADFGDDGVFLQFAPITFDASTFEIWGALLNGARLVIPPEGKTSLADLGKTVRENGVTTLWLTAGLFHLMVDERIEDLRPLRQLLAGGDVLSVAHVQKVLDQLDCDLINGYGPTENTTFTCTYKIPRDVELGRSVPIGKPIARTQVIILDEVLNPVNAGDIGELYIGGEGLARGYFDSEGMTAERFIPNPFPHISSSRLYRSGDLARSNSDGNIEFLGRVDNQVKIRGFRIELEEVELQLTRQSGINEAVAVCRVRPGTEKQLIAFVVPEPNCETDVCQLRKRLEETLPEYMVPSFIVSLDALPLTANGKVDRSALVAMVESESGNKNSLNMPETGSERKIAEILEEILCNGPVGANDNFFDLGADSLQMARFHNRLQESVDAEIKIVSLFQNPTVSSLARAIDRGGASDTSTVALRDRAARQRAVYSRQRQMLNGGN